MKNQDIFHAMTIKLEACDIPKEIPKNGSQYSKSS